MTREEAIDRLKTEVKRIEEIMENGDFGCVDMDTWNEFAKKAEWRETLIELLTGPTPDPDTGLVPCGGKLRIDIPPGNDSCTANQCIHCGQEMPEGDQVCGYCRRKYGY